MPNTSSIRSMRSPVNSPPRSVWNTSMPPNGKRSAANAASTSVFCQIEVVQNGVSIQSEKAAGFSPVERKDPPPLLFGFYPIRAWVRLYDSPSNLIILP